MRQQESAPRCETVCPPLGVLETRTLHVAHRKPSLMKSAKAGSGLDGLKARSAVWRSRLSGSGFVLDYLLAGVSVAHLICGATRAGRLRRWVMRLSWSTVCPWCWTCRCVTHCCWQAPPPPCWSTRPRSPVAGLDMTASGSGQNELEVGHRSWFRSEEHPQLLPGRVSGALRLQGHSSV